MTRPLATLTRRQLDAVAACHADCAGPLGYTIDELAEITGLTRRQVESATAILRKRGRWRLRPTSRLRREASAEANAAAPSESEIRWRCWQIQEGWDANDPRRAWGVVEARTMVASGPQTREGR